jgi:hypothetical protein
MGRWGKKRKRKRKVCGVVGILARMKDWASGRKNMPREGGGKKRKRRERDIGWGSLRMVLGLLIF